MGVTKEKVWERRRNRGSNARCGDTPELQSVATEDRVGDRWCWPSDEGRPHRHIAGQRPAGAACDRAPLTVVGQRRQSERRRGAVLRAAEPLPAASPPVQCWPLLTESQTTLARTVGYRCAQPCALVGTRTGHCTVAPRTTEYQPTTPCVTTGDHAVICTIASWQRTHGDQIVLHEAQHSARRTPAALRPSRLHDQQPQEAAA